MEIIFAPNAKKDLDFFKESGDKVLIKRISLLINSIKIDRFKGIGKPEPLRHYRNMSVWSRRINHEHRIVYEIIGDKLYILSLRGHYSN